MWCTTEKRRRGAIDGAPRTIVSSAFQAARRMMVGCGTGPAVRAATEVAGRVVATIALSAAVTGLSTKYVRRRSTVPSTRYWM